MLLPVVVVKKNVKRMHKDIVEIKNVVNLHPFHMSTKETREDISRGLDQNHDCVFPDERHKTHEPQSNGVNECLMLSLKAICFARGIQSGTVLDDAKEFQR